MRSTVVSLVTVSLLLGPGGSFVDDDGSVHEGAIEAMAAGDITRGCNPPVNDRFCPDEPVTRGQMAAFLARALDLPPSPVTFADAADSIFATSIGALAATEITRGCNPPSNTLFCPGDVVTRGQMAAFLARAFGYPTAPGSFVDVAGSVFVSNIGALAAAGVTKGCDPPANTRFCPDRAVTRAEMATFLARALDLAVVVPPPRCPTLPADDIWNTPVDDLPLDAGSDAYLDTIGRNANVHADFGSGVWPPGSTSPIGIPYVEIGPDTPAVPIIFTAYGDESDPGPYPVPPDAPIEGGPDSDSDRHVIVVDRFDCRLYEMFYAFPRADGAWEAASGAVYDLDSSALRTDGWTSADAAGMPIFPGLVRYDEAASGEITHAIRFTAPETRSTHVWPARHHAGAGDDPDLPPMGQRFRLRADFDTGGFHPHARVILEAMKIYGIVLADNGSSWYISGAPDPRWDNDVLHQLDVVQGSDFEAVDVSGLLVDPDSGTTAAP
ncbi:MAG: S-layer homology domain-containing protein [Acidimicrobiia bacterium]